MKESEKLSRKTRKMIAKNLIILAVLAFVAFAGVSSWFTPGPGTDTASGVNVICTLPEGLEVCVVDPTLSGSQLSNYLNNDANWKSESFTISDADYPFLAALSLADISGDGKTFISPPIYQISSVAKVQDTKFSEETQAEFNTKWSSANLETIRNQDYMSINLYFRTEGSGKKVVLDESSYFGPPSGPSASYDFGNRVAGFSPDAVIGAARMAVYNSSLNTRKLLWVPAPHLFFDGVELFVNTYRTTDDLKNTANTYGLFYTQNNATTNIHTDGTYNHGYYNSDRTRTVVQHNATPGTGVTSNNNGDYRLHTDVDVASLASQATYNGKQYYADFIQVNFWVEGEDPESRSAQITGKFKSILSFQLGSAS